MGAGKRHEAVHHLAKASEESEGRLDHHMKVAQKLIQLHETDKALSALRREIQGNPHHGKAYCLMGCCLMAKGQPDGALVSFDRAIALDPNNAMAYRERALAYKALRRLEEALKSVEQAVHLAPDDPDCLWSYAHLYRLNDHIDDALDILAKILHSFPGHEKSVLETAYAYKDNQQLDNALYYVQEAILFPKMEREAKALKAEILLQKEDWTQGWSAYEERIDLYPAPTALKAAPLWQGQTDKDCKLLIHVDGCFSDAIQFARFITKAKEKVSILYVACPKPLYRLFSGITAIDGLYEQGQVLPVCDAWCRLGSLPHVLKIDDLDALPVYRPYLAAHETDKPVWQDRVGGLSGNKKVGLVWQGDDQWHDDPRRSPGIWPFSRLFYMRDITFVGLQVGTSNDVLLDPQLAKMVHNVGIEVLDFADTAAVLDQLDLVITCDTAVAHLAGAMGKAVWVMIPYAHDWRWGTIDEQATVLTTPWYPSMTLYRQSSAGDWADVFARIGQDLDRFSRHSS